MATPSDSPVEEVMFEIEPSRVPKPVPVALEDLCRLTKFTRQEIRIMYRGFKTVSTLSPVIFRGFRGLVSYVFRILRKQVFDSNCKLN